MNFNKLKKKKNNINRIINVGKGKGEEKRKFGRMYLCIASLRSLRSLINEQTGGRFIEPKRLYFPNLPTIAVAPSGSFVKERQLPTGSAIVENLRIKQSLSSSNKKICRQSGRWHSG